MVCCLVGCPSVPKPSYPEDQSFRTAEASFLKGDYQTAINNYAAFITAQPYSEYIAEAYYRTGLSCLALGNHRDALTAFQAALARAGYPALKTQVLGSLGFLYFSQHNYPQAVKHYQSALKGDRNALPLSAVYYNFAIALMREGQWREGRKYMQMARDNAANGEQLIESITERLSLPPDTFVVQLGKFDRKDNAVAYQQELRADKDIKTSVNIILIEGQEFYYVWADTFPTYAEAVTRAEELRERALEAIIIP
jgi:tetratricopeptide (TPR) repeat protein